MTACAAVKNHENFRFSVINKCHSSNSLLPGKNNIIGPSRGGRSLLIAAVPDEELNVMFLPNSLSWVVLGAISGNPA